MTKVLRRTRKGVLGSFPLKGHGAEIGVFRGRFSTEIINECRPEKLYLIDPWINFEDPLYENTWYHKDSDNDMEDVFKRVTRRFKKRVEKGQVEILRGKSVDVADAIPDGSLDFVYIDGDHSYDGVKADLEIAFAKTKETAVIAIDDYYIGGWWKDGVIRATSEFLGAHADCLSIIECVEKQMIIQRRPPVDMAQAA
ncbi:MAG: hypothetical protein COB65_03295 [Thalassobium sp.]|nr:MAG: hypothetical protein COB65_03295 [Thalassobium sp.]